MASLPFPPASTPRRGTAGRARSAAAHPSRPRPPSPRRYTPGPGATEAGQDRADSVRRRHRCHRRSDFRVCHQCRLGGRRQLETAAGVSLQVPTTSTPRLAFTVQPGAGARIPAQGTFAVSVAIQDGFGTVVTSDSTDEVTLAIGHNPGHAGLACASPGGIRVPVSAGVATFTGCAITKAGTGYTLTATSSVSPALKAPANARPFDIVTGPAARVTSTTAPGSGPASTAGQGAPGASRPAAGGPGAVRAPAPNWRSRRPR
jgi:hypothetical protein